MKALDLIKKHIPPESTIIIGLSGGPDSVCLLHLFNSLKKELSLSLIAAHLDHQWRKNSADDVLFCKSLCLTLDVPFITKRIDKLDIKITHNGSAEEVARNYRKFFFKECMANRNAHFLALGHHADDQIETFFIRLIRGTTISGLKSMSVLNGFLIRPLLTTEKETIFEYLKQNKLSWCTDETNDSEIFLRNSLRKSVLPKLYECDSRAKKNIIRTIDSLQQTDNFLEDQTQKLFNELNTEKGLSIKDLKKVHPFMIYKILTFWIFKKAPSCSITQSFLDEIIRFLFSKKGGSHSVGKNWIIIKKSDYATIKVS